MINEQDFLDAIAALKPDAPFQIVGTDYATLIMLDDSTKPTLAQIESKVVQLQNDKVATAATKAAEKAALLAQLGITEEQAKLLLS